MDEAACEKILLNWRIVPVFGSETEASPENPDCRVVSDEHGEIWRLETIGKEAYSRRLEIAQTLELLGGHGLEVIHPYKRNSLGQFVTCYAGKKYMLRPYVAGVALDRKAWLRDVWRSGALVDFIINLRRVSGQLLSLGGSRFFLENCIRSRMEILRKHRADIATSLNPVFQSLEQSFFSVLDALPAGFCHGGIGPGSVLWGDESIQSVIGWGLCGVRTEAYDAAMLVGCIGFDNPDALISDATIRIIKQLRDACIYQPETWNVFFDLLVATRYQKLSEWMHANDEGARDLEMLYINLLTTQKRYILDQWGF